MIGPGPGEGLEIGINGSDHQMHVEAFLRHWPDGLDDRHTERDIGHEMPVHHVDMNPVGAPLINPTHFIAQPGEIGGENRG